MRSFTSPESATATICTMAISAITNSATLYAMAQKTM